MAFQVDESVGGKVLYGLAPQGGPTQQFSHFLVDPLLCSMLAMSSVHWPGGDAAN